MPDLPEATREELRNKPFDELWDMLPTAHQLFISRYAEQKFHKASKAYRETIYVPNSDEMNPASIKANASRLLRHPLIEAVLDQIGDIAKMSTMSSIAHLSEIAAADLADYFDVVILVDDEGAPILDAEGNYRSEIKLNLAEAIKARRTYPIKKIKEGQYGLEIELESRLPAHKLLLELGGKIGPARGTEDDPSWHVTMTPQQWAEEQQKRIDEAAETMKLFEGKDTEQAGLDDGGLSDME